MQFNTWGISKNARIVRDFDPIEFMFIEKVRVHLELTLIEIKGDGQPVQVGLGEPRNEADPDAATQQVTPFFSSFEALDYFCQLNLQQYLAFDPRNGLPRHWFWSDSKRARFSDRRNPSPAGNGLRAQVRIESGKVSPD